MNCPINYHNCATCQYRQEVNDCGYKLCPVCGIHLANWQQMTGESPEEHIATHQKKDWSYEEAIQQAAREHLVNIERQETPEMTHTIKGECKGEDLKQAMLNAMLGEYHAKGFYIVSSGGLLTLMYQDEVVFVISKDMSMTIKECQAACYLYLKRRGIWNQ